MINGHLNLHRNFHHVDGHDPTTRASADLRHAGIELRLVVGSADPDRPDEALLRLIVKTHELRDRLLLSGTDSMTTIVAREQVSKSYLTRLVRLVWLAPDIVSAILQGRQPEGVTATRLLNDSRLPLEWDKQRALLGFS